ncbi:MAG: hypothetical protein ABFS03_04920, partial [Chloroflexota bacterium]
MKSPRFIILGVLLFSLACSFPTLALDNTSTPEAPLPVNTILPTAAPELPTPEPQPILVRIQLVTTSDWTALNLKDGTAWLEHDLISFSEEATIAELVGSQMSLNQSIARAEAGDSVEMVVEFLFSAQE